MPGARKHWRQGAIINSDPFAKFRGSPLSKNDRLKLIDKIGEDLEQSIKKNGEGNETHRQDEIQAD